MCFVTIVNTDISLRKSPQLKSIGFQPPEQRQPKNDGSKLVYL